MTTMQTMISDDSREVKVLRSAALTGGGVPSRVLLAPWGTVDSANGSFVLDDESARLAVAAFNEHGTDLPIDYEHQTLGGTYSSPTGKAPAATSNGRLAPCPIILPRRSVSATGRREMER